jgi:hypothetical protein
VAARVVTCGRVVKAIDSFAPYRSPGMDGIFPSPVTRGMGAPCPLPCRDFFACLVNGYVPAIWHQVKVLFIPKPGRDSYGRPKDFRPISLTLFLLKTTNRLADRFLRDEILALMPLHRNQHAYQARKSVETALYQLVVSVEKVHDKQETALGVFLDI